MNYANTLKLSTSELDITETKNSEVISVLSDVNLGDSNKKTLQEMTDFRDLHNEDCQK
ncbi:MAG: hypothetical protein WC451_00240 [Patescibacteria group bacterium]|jgi:hypothetical protein